jgi:hypothetical protein
MSLDLATLQSSFAGAMLLGDASSPELDQRGLRVHRNTVLSGLCEALRLSYPATDRLIGSAFFDQAALAFARRQPPREPVLARYGAGFADSLATHPGAADLPYLADMARLEWAIDQAGLDAPGFDGARTACTLATTRGPAALVLAPSLRLLRLDHAVLAIWRAITERRYDDLEAADWRAGPEWLAIHHGGDDVIVTALSERAWRLAAHFLSGGDEPGDVDSAATEFLAAPFLRLAFTTETAG